MHSNNLGFDGYRFDAAKHAPLWYWRDHVAHNVRSWGKYGWAEVYSADFPTLDAYAQTGLAVSDYALYTALIDNFRFGGDLRKVDGAGFAMRTPTQALTFVENHDVAAPPNRLLAYAFLSAYVGYPMYDDDALTDPALRNLVWVHAQLAHGRYISRHASPSVLIFEREHSLLAGINQTDSWQAIWIDTTFRHTGLKDYAGHVGDTWAHDDGRVLVSLPPMSYVMLGAR